MATKDLVIKKGKTFAHLVYWAEEELVYKAISAIQQSAPVRITAATHGLTPAWPVAVTGVKGMTQINAEANNVKDKDYNPVTVIDPNTVEINAINAQGFKAYTSGGHLQYKRPVNLTGYSGRMTIKDKEGGTELLTLTVANGRVVIDTVNNVIALNITAIDTAALTWKAGVYDLEMVSPSGAVAEVLRGKITVQSEITT